MTIPLTLGVYSCKRSGWTNDLYMIKMIEGNGYVTVKDGSSNAQCSTGSFDSNGNAVLSNCQKSLSANTVMMICMPPSATAKIELTCQQNSGCLSHMYLSDGNRWPSRFTYVESHSAPYVDTWDFPSALTPLTSVSLSSDEINVVELIPMETVKITPTPTPTIPITPTPTPEPWFPIYDPFILGDNCYYEVQETCYDNIISDIAVLQKYLFVPSSSPSSLATIPSRTTRHWS